MAFRSDSALLLTRNNEQKIREDEERKRKAEDLNVLGSELAFAEFRYRKRIITECVNHLRSIENKLAKIPANPDPYLLHQNILQFLNDTNKKLSEGYKSKLNLSELNQIKSITVLVDETLSIFSKLSNVDVRTLENDISKLRQNCNKIRESALEMDKKRFQECPVNRKRLTILSNTLLLAGMGVMLFSLALGPYALFGVGVGAGLMLIGAISFFYALNYDVIHGMSNVPLSAIKSANSMTREADNRLTPPITSVVSKAFNSVCNFFKPKMLVNSEISSKQATKEFVAWRAVK